MSPRGPGCPPRANRRFVPEASGFAALARALVECAEGKTAQPRNTIGKARKAALRARCAGQLAR